MKSVSIIIPTYNEVKNIANCLNSIFIQDFPDELLEVLVLDGGSTDKTVEIAEKMGAKVINNPFKTEERGRSIGFKKAKGEIIGTIDADNLIPPFHRLNMNGEEVSTRSHCRQCLFRSLGARYCPAPQGY